MSGAGAFAAAALLALSARAAASAETVSPQEALEFFKEEALNARVLTASRESQRLMESPSAITVITGKDIRLSGAHTLVELIQYAAGMDGFTKTYSDMNVGARGSAVDETPKMLVLVDGQPVNNAVYGGIRWVHLPVDLNEVDRVEIVRGPASSVYGADALSGVIHIITLPVGRRRSAAAGSLGERGTARAGFNFNRVSRRSPWGVSFNGSTGQTERRGDSEGGDQAAAVAPNYQIKDWSKVDMVSYRADYDGARLKAATQGGFSTAHEGYNPSPGDKAIDRSRRRTLYLNNRGSKDLGADTLAARLGFRNMWQENERWAGGGDYAFKYRVPQGHSVDANLQYTMRRLPGHVVVAGADASRLRAARTFASGYSYDRSDRLYAAYVQDQLKLLDDDLQLTAGARYDKWSGLGGVLTPRAALNAFFRDKTLGVRAAVATSFRRPAFDENHYFVPIGAGGWFKGADVAQTTTLGQPVAAAPLRPEKLISYELGLRWNPEPGLYANVELYYQQIKDHIVIQAYPTSGLPNLAFANAADKTRARGVEVELKKRFLPALSGFLTYTYQYANQYRPPTETVFRRYNTPNNKASVGALYTGRVNVDVRARYVSAVTYSDIPSLRVDDYLQTDLGISKEVGGRLFVKVGVVNLFNQHHYEYGFYTPITRKAILTLEYSF